MFVSALELFTIGIGPSSSHTNGPMVAAKRFRGKCADWLEQGGNEKGMRIQCILKGSLAFTGKGHATDRAIVLGLHGFDPEDLADSDVEALVERLWHESAIPVGDSLKIIFEPEADICFDCGDPLPEHPNGMIFRLVDPTGKEVLSATWFSIGGGFVSTDEEIHSLVAPLRMEDYASCPYPFDSAELMLRMAGESGSSIAAMKRENELEFISAEELDTGLEKIWRAMRQCVERGLQTGGILPGALNLPRRAKALHEQLQTRPEETNLNEWLSAYAMAVNEENAAGHTVVTAPTNGAAGVIPAILYWMAVHENGAEELIGDFLLTASAIGGIIKYRGSISGAEVGCQGEVGAAAAMAAAGLCAIRGGTPKQIENAAEIALEHHLGMTCDPVGGLVQVPCIERNAFGAVKACTAASLALRGSGRHFMPLDECIAAMKQTGLEMSEKYKETSLGGLAVRITEC